jgi:hypothetical protein
MKLHHYMQCIKLVCYDYTSFWMKQLLIELLKIIMSVYYSCMSIISEQELNLPLTVRYSPNKLNDHVTCVPSITNVKPSVPYMHRINVAIVLTM